MPHLCVRHDVRHPGALFPKELSPGKSYRYYFCRPLIVDGERTGVFERDSRVVTFLFQRPEDKYLVFRGSEGDEFPLSPYQVGIAPGSQGAYICSGHIGHV